MLTPELNEGRLSSTVNIKLSFQPDAWRKHSQLKISPEVRFFFFFSGLLPSKLTNTWPASIATLCKS